MIDKSLPIKTFIEPTTGPTFPKTTIDLSPK